MGFNFDSLKPSWWPKKEILNKKNDSREEVFKNIPPDDLPVEEIPPNDIFAASDKERALINKRKELMNQHRQLTRNLESLGMNRISKKVDEKDKPIEKGSQTYKEYLGPIEKELLEVSQEINQLRQKFDRQPGREEVLKERLERLGEIRKVLDRQFSRTKIGEQYKEYLDTLDTIQKQLKVKIKELKEGGDKEPQYNPNYTLLRENSDKTSRELTDNFNRGIARTKAFMDYARTRDKITQLEADTEWWLRNAQNDEYDKDGFTMTGSPKIRRKS